jgi:hypothetical protein
MLIKPFPAAISYLKNSKLKKDSMLLDTKVAHALLYEMTKTGKMPEAKILYHTYKDLSGEEFAAKFKRTCEFWESITPSSSEMKCTEKISFFDQK